jgi:hypothetical protein
MSGSIRAFISSFGPPNATNGKNPAISTPVSATEDNLMYDSVPSVISFRYPIPQVVAARSGSNHKPRLPVFHDSKW